MKRNGFLLLPEYQTTAVYAQFFSQAKRKSEWFKNVLIYLTEAWAVNTILRFSSIEISLERNNFQVDPVSCQVLKKTI